MLKTVGGLAVLSAFFNIVEYMWTGSTTIHQFVLGVFVMGPILITYSDISLKWQKCFRYGLFPFSLWFSEIIAHAIMHAIHGYNPAWHYDCEYALFHGAIRLDYYVNWLLLGPVFDVIRSSLNVGKSKQQNDT